MVKKKYLLLTAMISLLLGGKTAFSQESQQNTQGSTQWGARDMTYRGQNYDVLDSNLIPKYRMDQHRKFVNHQYAFPAKPRNMWEVGFGLGMYNIMGDVPSLMPWQKGGYGLHLQVRKAWGYTISTRLQYIYSVGKGLQWQESDNYRWNPAWNTYYNYAGNPLNLPSQFIFYNYRTEASQLNLDLIVSLYNIRFNKARTNMNFYAFVGAGAMAFKVRVNALDNNYQPYDFASFVGNTPQIYQNRNTIRKDLQSKMDKSYETPAETEASRRRPSIFDGKTLDWAPSVGIGTQIRFTKRMNLQIEERLIIPNNEDLLDGQRWDENVNGSPVQSHSNDLANYLNVGLNFNLGNSKKNVEPLYWLNPLDFAYNELSYPRHMQLPEPILGDADGDGIADQFDKCPGTPTGVAVDSHGCPMDTDGDGVPDYKDKQLITPTECQPVDADGVGKCPCPEGCGTAANTTNCGNIQAGSVVFDDNSARIRPSMQAQLATLAAQMQANPTCKVVIIGGGNKSKKEQQRSWDRVHAIIEYLNEKHGIDRNRFIFQYGQAGDENTVMFRSAMSGEEGPSNVPPPFPNLRRE
jgi:hypothetical protein